MRCFVLMAIFFLGHITIAQVDTVFADITNPKTVTFYASDSVLVTADTYFLKNVPPVILLCHQANYSRGEYMETVKKLNALGYSCMAIDQRAGDEVNDVKNEMAKFANNGFFNVGYTGARRDMEAAIEYLYKENGGKPIVVVGSSYSASLALWMAVSDPRIRAVAAFSPGEYLKGMHLAKALKKLKKPVFITSSRREVKLVDKLARKIKKKYIVRFKPLGKGKHGSKALWENNPNHEAYWSAFINFLNNVAPL